MDWGLIPAYSIMLATLQHIRPITTFEPDDTSMMSSHGVARSWGTGAIGAMAVAMAAALPCAAQCQLGKLTPAGSARDDHFGLHVAVADGLVLAGAHGHDQYDMSGAAYVFGRAGSAWLEWAKLVPPQVVGFGRPLAADGNLAVIGALGVPRVYEYSGDAWLPIAELRPVQGFRSSSGSLAIYGQRVVVGAADNETNGTRAGAAFVFEPDPNGVWTRVARLLASDGSAVDGFGASVAVHGDVIVVGAPEDDPLEFASGSAYVFEREPNDAWVETAKLVPGDHGFLDQFGSSVAVARDTILVGALRAPDGDVSPGAVYAFDRDGVGGWVEVQKLTPPGGQNSYFFGVSVAVDHDLAVVGAENADTRSQNTGAAYVYQREPDGVWIQLAELVADNSRYQDEFGRSVAIDGNIAVVGAPFRDACDPNGRVHTDSGAAYVFAVSADEDGDGIMDACLCPGDVDGDFYISLLDLLGVLANFGTSDVPPDPDCRAFWATRCAGDVDNDGDVDLSDLAMVLANYDNVCP